jgi:DNA topoisomerase-1
VLASNGHIMDLPKSELGVDLDNDFEPKYVPIRGKSNALAKIKEAAKTADRIFLAPDPDREGEAIAWHLAGELKSAKRPISRLTFNEITERAVRTAMENPRDLDMNLVNAQQARRVLDRLVGYKVSPFVWKTVRYGLSAGRVQSVALRLICEREAAIRAFVPGRVLDDRGRLRDSHRGSVHGPAGAGRYGRARTGPAARRWRRSACPRAGGRTRRCGGRR